jgi:outer membrane protein OmpA-like peptidoglycan-associated protein
MRNLTSLVTCSAAVSFALCTSPVRAQAVSASAAASETSAASSAAGPKARSLHSNYFEVGLFGGVVWLSDNHALYARDQQPLNTAPEMGARVAYFPVPFLGGELEGAAGRSKTDSGDPADIWTVRAHAVAQLPGSAVVPFALLGGGVLGAGSNVTGADSDKLFHFGAGVKVALDDFLGLRLDLRDNLTQKVAASSGTLTHSPEVTLGLTFTLDPSSHAAPPAAPADADGDGLADAADKCPTEPGPAPEGCPPAKDSDSDGIYDERDGCPNEAGPMPTGCPDRDTDHDCVPVPQDKCPEAPGLPTDGCPDPDADHDGIKGDLDKCPTQPETANGFEDGDGCPDTLPEKIKKYSGVVPGIEFDLGRATIRPASRPTLDEAASVLKEYAALRIAISGHTDNVGDRLNNVDLSKARAESVKAYLVQQGIDAARIETRGAGPDEPIADNKLEVGRQKNRRIEFKLIQQ